MTDECEAQIADARARILSAVPKCLSQLHVTRVANPVEHSDEDDGELITSFEVACNCDCGRAQLLGYSLADFNASYNGELQFIRPIHFGCLGCHTETLIVDEHGYNSEVAKSEGGVGSATYRGTGATSPFLCHHCGNSEFNVTLTFVYSDGAFDLFIDEPELSAVDFFDVFETRGNCASCKNTSLVASFEG